MKTKGNRLNIFSALKDEILKRNNFDFINQRYAKNMSFFSHFNKKLFTNLKLPPKQYSLSFNDDLNILDFKINSFLYPKNNLISSHEYLSFDPIKNEKFELSCNFNLDLESNLIGNNKLEITSKFYNKLLLHNAQYVKNNNEYLSNLHQNMTNFIPNLHIFGLLSGIFLQGLIDNGYFFNSVLIYEENIDLFRISLFFIDFPLLFERTSERNCFLMIENINLSLINGFLYQKRITNNIFTLSLKQYNTPKILELKNFINGLQKSIFRGFGSFEDEMIGLQNAFQNLKKCNILTFPKRINAPICVVGNGASLDFLLPFIKKNQDKMIIFSSGTALKVLLNNDINPDFHIEIERIPYLKEVILEAMQSSSKVELDINLIYAQVVNPNILPLFKDNFCFFRSGSVASYITENSKVLEFSAPFVGNAAFSLAALFGSDIIICGLDCGFIKGFAKHSKNSFYKNESVEIPKNAFKIKGNKHLEVFGNDLFNLSLLNIEEAIKFYKPNNVLNLSFGAFINGALSVSNNDFSLKKIHKREEINKIKECFKEKSNNINLNLNNLKYFLNDLDSLKNEKVLSLIDLYNKIDRIMILLQNYIIKDKFFILIEGSVLHICKCVLINSMLIVDDDLNTKFKYVLSEVLSMIKEMSESNFLKEVQ